MKSFDLEIDTSGLLCPEPLKRAKQALKTLEKGQVLKVITTDPAAVIDFKAFAAVSSHELVYYEKNGFWIKKN